MEFHPVADIFPMMSAVEYAGLRDDIQRNGLRERVWTYQGKIIDGRNRYQACIELGMTVPCQDWNGNDADLVSFVMSMNLERRHLDAGQRAGVALAVEEYEAQAARLRVGGRPKKGAKKPSLELGEVSGKASERAAKATGASRANVENAKKLKAEDPALFGQMMAGEVKIDKAMRQLKDKARDLRKSELLAKATSTHKDYRVICGDFREIASHIPDATIDAIITDPPYPKEYLPLFQPMAEMAARVLKPGGSLCVMCGQSYLPQIIEALARHLTYQWTLAYLTPGAATQLYQRKVNTSWKPILWFVKGEYRGEWIQDVMKSESRDKEFHEWGQSESGTAALVERFSEPGGIVFDPFTGGGTTGVVAAHLKRCFLGAELDAETARIAEARIHEAMQ